MAAKKWKLALIDILEQLDDQQFEKMLFLVNIPKKKKTDKSREQIAQTVIEHFGEEKSIGMVHHVLKLIPRKDSAVQNLLRPFVKKMRAAGKKRKREADPEAGGRIPQQKSADVSKENQLVADSSGKNEEPGDLKSPLLDKVGTSSSWRIPIAELESGISLSQKSIVGKVVKKSALRTYETKNKENKFFFHLGIADDSGCIKVMVYGKEKHSFFKQGHCYNFRDVIVEENMMKFTIRSKASKAGKLDVPKDLEKKAEMLFHRQDPVVSIEEIKYLGQKKSVSAEGTVKEICTMKDKQTKRKRREFKLEDTTGSIYITLWGKDTQQLRGVSVGDFVSVTNVMTSVYCDTISLNSTNFTRIFKMQGAAPRTVQMEIIGIKRAGGLQMELDAVIDKHSETLIVKSTVLAEALGIQKGSDFEERILEKIPFLSKAEIKGNNLLKLTGMRNEQGVEMRV